MSDLTVRHGDGRLPHRFWVKVDRPSSDADCWVWLAAVINSGYGKYRHEGRDQLAHRVAYAMLVSPIPIGLVLDHLCRTPRCVNPAHLEPVTNAENVRRGVGPENSRNVDLCRNGLHPWPESARWQGGQFKCIGCRRASLARLRAKASFRSKRAAYMREYRRRSNV